MDKKFTIGKDVVIAIAVIGLAALGYWYYQRSQKTETTEINAIQQAGNVADDLGKNASQGVLPSIDPQSNPFDKAPDVNPISKTNPFSDIKTNPFK